MKKVTLAVVICLYTAACTPVRQQPMVVSQTKVIDKQGHRGCRGLLPENTIAAMLKAIDLNVTTLEMDVVISADKKVVVSHDPYFNEKITTTPEGGALTKAEAAKRLLYTMTYDSISKYDVGLRPHPDFPKQQKIAANKPLLASLLAATEDYAAKHNKLLEYNIEIKSAAAGDNVKHPPVAEFVDLVMAVVNSKQVAARTTIQSFDFRALQAMHRMYPTVTLALLIEDDDKRTLDQQLAQLGFTPGVYSPHFSLVTPALVKACHQNGMRLVPWTINDIDEMKRLIKLGVDGIISDYPDLFVRL